MDTQDYLSISIAAGSEEMAEIIEAVVSDLGFDSFMYDEESKSLLCYIQSPLFDEDALKGALSDMPSAPEILRIEAMPSRNWNEEWERTGFTPVRIGSVVVSPATAQGAAEVSSIEKEAAGSEIIPIWLDPQMAFGTGHHQTTCMMIETLLDLRNDIKDASVMDLGCGTAVLALVAARLGAGKVSGIDIDATAARSAQGNVRLNGLDFGILCGDAHDLKQDSYDFLLANIHRNIIIEDLPLHSASLHEGGHLLLSGFYESDIADIVSAAEQFGFQLVGRRISSGWACLHLKRVSKR